MTGALMQLIAQLFNSVEQNCTFYDKSKTGTKLEALHPLNSFGSEIPRPSPKLTVLRLSESEPWRKMSSDNWRLPRTEVSKGP